MPEESKQEAKKYMRHISFRTDANTHWQNRTLDTRANPNG